MEAVFLAALAVLTIFYAGLLLAAAIGFKRLPDAARATKRAGAADRDAFPSVTVLIPARNEAAHIGACLDSVLDNDYPPDRLEVIVIDDGSTDATSATVEARIAQGIGTCGDSDLRIPQPRGQRVGTRASLAHPASTTSAHFPEESDAEIRLIRLDEDPDRVVAHKKAALARGVEEARGEIILTTDADCVVSRTWIRTMIGAFGEDTGMVTGPVVYRARSSFLQRVQRLEFLGLVALGAGFVGIGRPHLCNSANLAYRRRAFEAVGGYDGLEDVTTGDDEMLLHRIAYESPWGVRSCMVPEAVVETDGSATLGEFFAQRKRWASAHTRYPHARLTITSALCYLFFVGLVAAGVLGYWGVFGGMMGAKLAAEWAVLGPAARRFGIARDVPLLIPAQLLHIPYILVIGLAGTVGGYEWKDRRLAR